MKHFSTQEWIDFVNHVAKGNQQEAMQKHLATGCKRCRETVSLWHKVSKTAAAEASYQPPASTVRLAKAAFATAGMAQPQKESRGVIEVLFDSFLQPAVAGARSVVIGTRQMLYRADPYQIDIPLIGMTIASGSLMRCVLRSVTARSATARSISMTVNPSRKARVADCRVVDAPTITSIQVMMLIAFSV